MNLRLSNYDLGWISDTIEKPNAKDAVNDFQSYISKMIAYVNSIIKKREFKPSGIILTVDELNSFSDDDLSLVASLSEQIDLPKILKNGDSFNNPVQSFVYILGINSKPIVLKYEQFLEYMRKNNISLENIISRSIMSNSLLTAKEICDQFMFGEYNFIAGRYFGCQCGLGAYFRENGGNPTGYDRLSVYSQKAFKMHDNLSSCCSKASHTMIGCLNPLTARIVDYNALVEESKFFCKTHGKLHSVIGNCKPSNASIYALAMGYNVIQDSERPKDFVIIDRGAVVLFEETIESSPI